MSIDRIAWLARRSKPTHRRWSKAEIKRLEAMVGKRLPPAMARELNRPVNSVMSKLMQLGYRVTADIMTPLGLNAEGVARRLGIPREVVYKAIHSGKAIPMPPRKDLKQNNSKHSDFLIPWPQVRQLERYFAKLARRRQRALARIKVPTITKPEFMKQLNLSETHGQRYLLGGIVRAWKIPSIYDEPKRQWEWRISRSDTYRVKKLRESGKLKLNKRRYRRIQKQTNKEITRLRRERRLGLRDELRRKKSPLVPGTYSVAQIAQMVKLSESDVYAHIGLGRLKVRRVPLGNRTYIVVYPDALKPYLEWCERLVKATGPIVARRRQIQSIHAAGLLTISDAANEFNVNRGSLCAAVAQGRVKSRMVDGMRGLRRRDVAAFARTYHRRKK